MSPKRFGIPDIDEGEDNALQPLDGSSSPYMEESYDSVDTYLSEQELLDFRYDI